MRKSIFEMTFRESPIWLQLMVYSLFILMLIPFTIPVCIFSLWCFGLWVIDSISFLIIVLMFPNQKIRESKRMYI